MSEFQALQKRRVAVERWKTKNREYDIQRKKQLAHRPEYLEHRRVMYKERVLELKELGILPRKRGRPQMYSGEEALEMKRRRAREAMC